MKSSVVGISLTFSVKPTTAMSDRVDKGFVAQTADITTGRSLPPDARQRVRSLFQRLA